MEDLSDIVMSSQADPKPMAKAAARPSNSSRIVDETAEQVRQNFEEFLSNYVSDETMTNLYVEQIKILSQHQKTTIYVDFQHLLAYDDVLANTVSIQYFR